MKISEPRGSSRLGSSQGWSLITSLLGINTVAVLLSVWVGISQGNLPAYFGEGSVITWISALQLLAIAFVSLKLYLLRDGQQRWSWRSPTFIWLLVALGFVFLAADELLEIHEQLDAWLHTIWSIQETALTDRIDDLIVGLYGVAAAGLVYLYRREIKRYSQLLPLIFISFAVLFVMVFLDVLTNRPDILSLVLSSEAVPPVKSTLEVLEEYCKLIVGSLFLASMYQAFSAERRTVKQAASAQNGTSDRN